MTILTRVMHKDYIDALFNDGALRLSSFGAFRNHPDEKRRDKSEGCIKMELNEPNGTWNALLVSGQEAYILCTSTIEEILEANSDMGSFKITDTLGFVNAIADQIPGFVGIVEGHCNYQDETTLKKNGSREIAPVNGKNYEEWFEEQNRYLARQSMEEFFLKHSSFEHESEYRFIWFATGKPKEYIDINVRDALAYCKRV